MKDLIGEDLILWRDGVSLNGFHIPAKSVGRLVEILGEHRVALFFEGIGRAKVPVTAIRMPSFKVGQRVLVKAQGAGIITEIWVSSAPTYMYRVRLDSGSDLAYEAPSLHHIPEPTGVPMEISELVKHMIATGTGVSYQSVPEWFQSIVNVFRTMPELHKMGQAQMEFVIRKHMEYRRIDSRADLVTNVLFGVQSSLTNPALRTIEPKLHVYKEKLDIEWAKLNKLIPVEFQYAALRAYAETLND